ncbi:hypothetical protein [Hymenobacter nivis]|uniref:Uncharacterized protein n=1 Tax=Hymenobacter nivis TaxID=1850093 RepID=A0A2Z3GLE6_9BACT|nr:hypothetical protein [Hymenobacter nivis]AWM33191.1 hypothetical protein DDQ68_10620 [Hymenobacter nivis]
MAHLYRLRFPWLGLLVAVWAVLSALGARAQEKPALPPGPGVPAAAPALGAPATAAPAVGAPRVAPTAVPPPSSRRCRYLRLAPGRDTTDFALADTLTIVPASVTAADGRAVPYDARTGRYRWVRSAPRDSAGPPRLDSVLLCYRVLPLRLEAARYRRPLRLMDSLDFRRGPIGYEDFSVKEQILNTPGISKTGNLARGVSFGNTQNVFVNSALNLQLEGQLTDGIHLTAAISDQNVPFQPEGNTQQLQQFDKIYITLTSKQGSLTAGDVVLRNKPDYFLRYYKNIQGAALEANFGPPLPGLVSGPAAQGVANTVFLNGQAGQLPVAPGGAVPTLNPAGIAQPQLADPNRQVPLAGATATASGRTAKGLAWQSSTAVAGGVAKGKFASLEVAPLENVQGPYRLVGPNGEQFIIVLANSERVYLDGRLQVRGYDADYTIDYNLAEVTFTPRHLITRNSRIKIDFEYSDLNYSRSLYALSHYQQIGKLGIHANYYQEADNPDNAANLELGPADRLRLRAAGNVAAVDAPGADSAVFNRTIVQYHRAVVLPPGALLPVAVFTYVGATSPIDSVRGVYTVRFTDLGQGNGDYVASTRFVAANGRVYEYVAPVGGVRQGRYQPVRRLPTPQLKQLVSAGASYEVARGATVFVDAATSRLDRNRFSPESDRGGAVHVGYVVQDRRLNLPGLRDYRVRSALDYEYTAPRFAPIDRYRDIEFDRNWSTASTVQGNAVGGVPREDNILNFSVGLAKNVNNNFSYRLSKRYRPGEVNGTQHWLDGAQKFGGLELRGSLFLLNSEAGRFRSSWARGEGTARFVGGALVPGYAYRFDKNRVALPGGDSTSTVNYFDEHNVFVQSRDSARTKFRLDYSYRRDQGPTADRRALAERSAAQTWQGSLAARPGRTQDLRIVATYRSLAQRDSALSRTALGKIDYNVGLFQNQVRSELSYSVATGRELRRDYSYLAVPAGQGTHYWRDAPPYDGIQQKNEFFEAQTADAQYRTYIKVYLPTADYLIAFTNRLSYRLTTAAPRGWREAGGWRAVAARFATLSSVTVDRRTANPNLGQRLSPFGYGPQDDQLLAFNQLMRNTVYFNRSNPIFGAEFTVQQTQQKTLLTQGFDLRNLATQSLLVRRTLAQFFTGRLTLTRDIREAQSDYLTTATTSRNFRLLNYIVQPEISYQPSPALRLTGTYLRTTKRNVRDDAYFGTAGVFDELGLEARISQVSKRTVTAATRFTRVGFAGDPTSAVGIEILNALRAGANFTWNLNLEQRLSNGLNLTLAYDGRKASGLNVVHTGRMQVAVLF